MSSDQTIDLVNKGVEFHQTLGKHYRDLKHIVTEEQTKMALDFLEKQEGELESNLRAYRKDVPTLVAARWFKYSPNDELKKTLDESEPKPGLTVSELSTLAVHYSACLTRFYRQFAEQAVPEDLEQALQKLVELEEQARKKAVRALQEQV